MAGRGPQSFKKRQKEQHRKEKQQEKLAKRLERRRQAPGPLDESSVSETPRGEIAERESR
jgi:hypothetical protein